MKTVPITTATMACVIPARAKKATSAMRQPAKMMGTALPGAASTISVKSVAGTMDNSAATIPAKKLLTVSLGLATSTLAFLVRRR